MFLIVSYPRSGNHLLRFFVEYLTGRSTLGCLDNRDDRPICKDEYDEPDVLAHVTVSQPIGHKAHFADEVRRVRAERPIAGAILMVRDPMESIFAHVERPRRDLADLIYRWRLQKNVAAFEQTIRAFMAVPGQKLFLCYERWISADPEVFSGELDKLARFLGPAVQPGRLESAKARASELKRLSANPKKRTWKGYRSQAKARFHQDRASARMVELLRRRAAPLYEEIGRAYGRYG